MTSSPYALGVYVGNPFIANPTAQAQFNANFQSFVATMGVTPTYSDAYIDQSQPISQWVGNTTWLAQQYASTAYTQGITPVIGLPMASSAAGSESADQSYQDFASGKFDGVIQGVVKAWAAEGYSTQVWRPGWEMNLSSSPWFAGNDAATQADWVKAFQHIYDVLHEAGQADGVKVQVVWNPATINYTNAEATTNLYPGNNYVDVIGADVYSDVSPYGNPNSLYNWDASGDHLASSTPVFSTLQQWAADPVNLVHYYTDPASTQWSLDGSNGHSLSLQNIIDFAKAEGKPLAIEETGAGSTNDGAGVSDNPTFVNWLSNTLANAGVPITNVNIWDSDGGGAYEFSNASDNKPLEAGAWAADFGATPPPTITAAPATTVEKGMTAVVGYVTPGQSGDALTLAQTAGLGTLSLAPVQGTLQEAVVYTAPATIAASGPDKVSYTVTDGTKGGAAASTSTVTLDAGSTIAGAASATVANGQTTVVGTVTPGESGDTLALMQTAGSGALSLKPIQGSTQEQVVYTAPANVAAVGTNTVSYSVTDQYHDAVASSSSTIQFASMSNAAPAPPPALTVGSGPDTLVLQLSEDAFEGDAQATVSVDGTQVGGVETITASHGLGADENLTVEGNWGPGSHSVAVDFLNDLYQPGVGDRNLYVDGATYDGVAALAPKLALMSGGSQSLTVQNPVVPATVVLGSGSSVIDLQMAEDAFQGDAKFTVSIDGIQVGGTQTAQDSQAAKTTQDFKIEGNWALGSHTVSVDFLNDLYQPGIGDRNLYVDGASVNGTAQPGGTLSLYSAGTQAFTVQAPPATVVMGSGPNVIDLQMAEDAFQGDAQFTVSVDGVQVGGTQTAQDTQASKATQDFKIEGNWGGGTHTVSVDFLNDLYQPGAGDRNLYVDGASVNGTAQPGGTLSLYSAGTQAFTVQVPAPAAVVVGSGPNVIDLQMAEDAFQGDAQFTVSVDGVQVGGTQTAQDTQASKTTQDFKIEGNWGVGTHAVTVNFLNDLYQPGIGDRNLYVDGVTYGGAPQPGGPLALLGSGPQTVQVTSATTYNEGAAGGAVTTQGNDTVVITTGNVTINDSGPSLNVQGGSGQMSFIGGAGSASIVAGSGAATITGGSGALTYTAGTGSATITAGSGTEVFNLVSGQAGGTLLINGFVSGSDSVHLSGYTGTGIKSEQVTGGSTNIVLTDNTKITLAGFSANSSHPVFV